MSDRINIQDLKGVVIMLSRLRPDIDWELSSSMGGHQLNYKHGKGAENPFSHGHLPKKECYQRMQAFMEGLSFAKKHPIDDDLLDILQSMQGLVLRHPHDCTFTVERAKGETYGSGEPTVYAHWEETSGVLAGKETRQYVGPVPICCVAECFVSTAEAFCRALPDHLNARTDSIEGTTHVPVDQVVAHLPEDEG